jgi:hypothetical protein
VKQITIFLYGVNFSVSEMQPGCIIAEQHRDRLALQQKSLRHRESFFKFNSKIHAFKFPKQFKGRNSELQCYFCPAINKEEQEYYAKTSKGL